MITKLSKPFKWLFIVLLFTSWSVSAEEEDEEEGEVVPSIYVAVDPAFVSNYGGPGRLRYMKVEVSLRVKGPEGEASINHHLPNIKDSLLSLFSIQTNETLGTATGKEGLRIEALAKINALLIEEDKTSHLEDVLFTSFVVER